MAISIPDRVVAFDYGDVISMAQSEHDRLGMLGAVVQRPWAIDVRSWISVEPGTVDLLAELHGGGTRLVLLSNAGFEFVELFARAPMSAFFERIFVSAQLGMLKPDAAIYLHVCDELAIDPAALVFIDNKPDHVAGAESIGATGHVFTGVKQLGQFVRSLAR